MNNKTYTQEAVQELVILPEQELVIVEPATAYDADGYGSIGYDKNGFDRDGYNCYGYNAKLRDRDGYDRYGYNSDGYNSDGYNCYGYNSDGYDCDGYNSDGYDCDGYDRYGYDCDGYNENGYNYDGYDSDGYDRYGYDENGYDENGYDSDGYDRDGYDRDGYNYEGYDQDGYNQYGGSNDDENYSYVADYKTLRRFDSIGDCTGYTLGFELEVVYKPELISDAMLIVESSKEAIAAIAASDNEERVLAERDGSLPPTGVEFVTGYCNWDAHVEHLESLCDELYTRGFGSHRSAGVHIHVGNHGLSNYQTIAGFVLCGINQPLIEAVAGRYTGDYVRAGFMPEDGPMDSSRYNAVNWRYNTVEFRMFSSTTCFTRLSMYAEFCRATVEYVNMLDALDTNIYIRTTEEFKASPLMYTRFVAWVSDNQARFPLLHDTIKELTGNNTGD